MKRFSKKELFEIRNYIPIQNLIKDLNLPSINENNIFRFLCPICNGYNTSIKYDTNLARCFNCCVNFNTIEIAMKVRTPDFVDNVKFLKQYLNNYHTDSKNQLNEKANIQFFINKCQTDVKVQSRSKNDLPVHIGKIFNQNKIEQNQESYLDDKFNWSDYCRSNDMRISNIEKKVELVLNELDALHKRLNRNNTN